MEAIYFEAALQKTGDCLDMDWNKLDKIHAEMMYSRPPDSFTIQEYADHYDISYSGATKRLQKLVRQGVVKKYHQNGRKAYFILEASD